VDKTQYCRNINIHSIPLQTRKDEEHNKGIRNEVGGMKIQNEDLKLMVSLQGRNQSELDDSTRQ